MSDQLKLYSLPDPQEAPPVSASDVSSQIRNLTEPVQMQQNYMQSGNFVKGSAGWKLDAQGNLEANNGNFRGDITGASGTFSGTVSVGSLNIPDTTTANSAHVDSAGNTWWGANVASGITNAKASVTNTGTATFKDVIVGGTSRQYQIGNGGMFSFGDGSDGAGVADGSTALAGATLAGSTYTLTRDVYYTDLTVSTGVTIKPSGYRIFGNGTLTLNGTGAIERNGIAGTAGGNGTGAGSVAGGAGGAALPDGYLKGSLAGANGGASGAGGGANPGVIGSSGTAATNSLGSNGSAGGAGAVGGTGGGAAGGAGTGGTVTASNVKLIANWHLATLLDISSTGSTVKFANSASAAGGGGGGANGSGLAGGAGGGGGGAGGIIAIYFKTIVIGASASITANGGAGGNGGSGSDSGGGFFAGGGGGGGGGNGGEVIVCYNTLTNSGSLAATAGAGGTAGGNGGQSFSVAGVAGSAGHVRQFELSL